MERETDPKTQQINPIEERSLMRERLRQIRQFVSQGRLDKSILERAQEDYHNFLIHSKSEPEQVEATPPSQGIALVETTTTISIPSVTDFANLIINLVPEGTARLWSKTGQLSPEQYQEQAITLANFIRRIEEGAEKPVQAAEILHAHQDQKMTVAQSAIRQTLAQMILRSEQLPLSASKNRWGRHIRELADWLGANAKQNIIDAIENLSEVERALVFDISSVNLLKDLDFIDLEECDEVRFAAYLRGAAFIKENDLRDEVLGEMIVAVLERSDAGTLNVTEIIHHLLQIEYSELLFQKIFDSAKYRRFRDELMVFFYCHPGTKIWAQKTDDSRFSDHLDEEVPRNRRIT